MAPIRKKRRKVLRQKVCRLCENQIHFVDYKDIDTIRRFQTEQGRILPRRVTGNCYKHQNMIDEAIKRARNLALVL